MKRSLLFVFYCLQGTTDWPVLIRGPLIVRWSEREPCLMK